MSSFKQFPDALLNMLLADHTLEHVQPLRMEWSRTGVWRPVREPIVDGLLGLPLPSQGRAIDQLVIYPTDGSYKE